MPFTSSLFENLWSETFDQVLILSRHAQVYLLGDGESNDGVPLQDLPRDHGRVDLNLSDGHIERSWQRGVWLSRTFGMATQNKLE